MTTAPVRTERPATEQQIEPPYALILYNDDHNSMAHVVQSLQRCVPDISHEGAFEIMMLAHQNGKARVTVAPRPEAARYRDCLESRGLTATIEPAYD